MATSLNHAAAGRAERLRIVLTTPYAHPHVRRGTERYVHELARWMGARGHSVTVLSTGPARETVTDRGVTVHYLTAGAPVGRGRVRAEGAMRAGLTVGRAAGRRPIGLGIDFDVAEVHHFGDGAALRLADLGRRRPYVLWIPGVARPESFGGRPLHRAALRLAASGAARIHSISRFARDALFRQFGIESDVVPPGVDIHRYEGPKDNSGPPVILCTSAPEDPRKQVTLLLEAFERLVTQDRDTRLVLAPHDPAAAHRLVSALTPVAARRVEVRSGLSLEELADLYRRATVTVLPSTDEAFGLVLVESLAAGTPVVGAHHGAIPELVGNEGIGLTFAAGEPRALERALQDVLAMAAGDEGMVDRCRSVSRRWDWDAVGPTIEAVYDSITR